MTQPGEHLDDDTLSAAIDDRLTPDEAARARAHLETCEACGQRLADLRSVVGLLRTLPSLEPPRRLFGPRLVADPPNVVRLRRLYIAARTGAAALAAVFVFASVGALYVGASPRASPPSAVESSAATPVARPQLAPVAPRSAPAADQGAPAADQGAPAAAAQSAPAPPQSAPAAAAAQSAPAPPQGAPAAAASRASAPAPASSTAADANQARVATGVPAFSSTSATALPTPQPASAPPPAAGSAAPITSDPAAALRTTAIVALLLAALGTLTALFTRRRLGRLSRLKERATSSSPTE